LASHGSRPQIRPRRTRASLMTATQLSPRTPYEPPRAFRQFESDVTPTAEPWSLPKRIGFRFVACYFVLYSFTSFVGAIPLLGIVAGWYGRAMQTLTVWT